MSKWDELTMAEKAEMMKVAVRNGITKLQDIRDKYNEFAEGGDTDWSYNNWKKQIAEHMGIRPDEDNTYDYEAYFNKYPEEAWKMLKGDPTAHFSDEFKTVYHPTFSSKSFGNDGSIYSGVRNPKTNPQGLVGGTWSPDYKTFTMSPDGYRGPVSMDDRKWYLENAEDNGVVLREADGSLPVYDDIPWGGVLPNIIINGSRRGRKFEDGGFTSELDWSPDSWFSKRVAKPDGTLYNDEEAARLASHVPEYNNIEQTAKANGTWLKMSDGSIWKGDPRSWVMMQSESYKKNYSPKPWYTGQAEWPTTFDYGKGKVDTNKVTRAPYYNNQMWFSDSEDYGQTFADYQNSTGLGWRFDTLGEENIKGHNFLSAIPKKGNYRTLESPANGRPDQWQRLPFVLEDGTINRLPESQISVDSKGRNIRADKQKVLTDDVVNWSKDLGDQGIFMQNIDDGAIIKNGEILRQPVNEFISQPGFTDKVKFIEGNTGDFDIDNPYKYANNFYDEDTSLDNNYAALGGPIFRAANQFKGGGYKPSDSVKKRISTWEGAAMTGAIDPLSGKWRKNRSFEAEADSFYNALPASIRSQVLSNPELADNLFSYSYNVGAGNFKKRVVPALEKYYTGNGSLEEIANSMWATGDKKLRGLRNRRAVERKGVVDALTPAFVPEPADNTFMPNPFAIQMENTYQRPVMVPDEDSYVIAHEVSPSEQRAQKVRESFDAINRFNALMNMLNMDTTAPTYTPDTDNPFLDAIGVLTNSNANGGKIHIAPSKRGTFTAAAKKHGKSVQAFASQVLAHPENYSPAMRKKANFARNAAKWHGLGGNLFGGETEGSQQMISKTATPEENVFSSFIVRASEDPMVKLAKQNPKYRDTLAKMYDDENFKYENKYTGIMEELTKERTERLLDLYNHAGKPKLVPLSNRETRACTSDIPFFNSSPRFNRPTLHLNTDPVEGFSDLVAELSHPIQKKYGNNKPWKERINPFYDEDNYKGKTRYDFPNTYEYETHTNFEPMFWYYITDNALPKQQYLTDMRKGKLTLGNEGLIFNPSFQQLVDSAKANNKSEQEIYFQSKKSR